MKKISAFSGLILMLSMSLLFSAVFGVAITSYFNHPEYAAAATGVLFVVSILMPAPEGGKLFITFTEGLCEKIQSSLIEILGTNAPSLKRTKTGYLSAVTSPQNTAGVTMVPVDPGNGKKKTVRIKYIQRGTEADVAETELGNCEGEVEREPKEDFFEVTRYLRSPGLKFDTRNMRLLCESDASYMAGIMNAEIDALVRVLNKKLITLQNTNFGQFNPNLTPNYKSIILLTGAKRSPNYSGESEIIEAFEYLDTAGRPILVGAGTLSHYTRQIGIGCCNQDGINLAQAGNLDFFHDRFVEGIVGSGHFIGLIPGHVQLATWVQNTGEYAKQVPNLYEHGTIVDPLTGLTFDFEWNYDNCDKVYRLHFGISYDLWFMPSDAYKVGDEMYGVNGSLNFLALEESDYCC